ncbi:MAG: alpha-ketoacid dehydrogenase subunit beta [Candidatus Omnitrophota bacterium]
MKTITYGQAINEALYEEMQRDSAVVLLGEDITIYGGAFGVTKDLWKIFGKDRVINTPISENSFVGAATGMAMMGLRPVVEIMFMDFITLACDQIINQAAKLPYLYAGQVSVPMVIRTPAGAGRGYGASHSQSLERLFMGIPGIKIVSPYTPYEAKGLLKSAIRSDSLIIFVEHKLLYSRQGQVPETECLLEIEKAQVLKEGKDVTLISYSKMLDCCLEAADALSGDVDLEIINLRSLRPIDIDTIAKSVKKTGRVVIVEEGHKAGGVGSEICSQIAESCLEYLNGRIVRVASEETPIPSSRVLEDAILPNRDKIIDAVKKTFVW